MLRGLIQQNLNDHSVLKLLGYNHCKVIFKFDSNEWLLTEVTGDERGTTILIEKIYNYNYVNYKYFKKTSECEIDVTTIINWCK